VHGGPNTSSKLLHKQTKSRISCQDLKKTGSTSRKSFKRLDMAQKRKIAKNDVENLVSAFPKLSIK
jgi:hypothetical protein